MGLYSRTLCIGLVWRGWGDIKYIEKRDKNYILPSRKTSASDFLHLARTTKDIPAGNNSAGKESQDEGGGEKC